MHDYGMSRKLLYTWDRTPAYELECELLSCELPHLNHCTASHTLVPCLEVVTHDELLACNSPCWCWSINVGTSKKPGMQDKDPTLSSRAVNPFEAAAAAASTAAAASRCAVLASCSAFLSRLRCLPLISSAKGARASDGSNGARSISASLKAPAKVAATAEESWTERECNNTMVVQVLFFPEVASLCFATCCKHKEKGST